ncbi:MAG: hypothetical protein Q8K82_01210 [Gemmatimonadaceae bacterium]|nr:hypothetical protein [Gemmatimonadaceae bacterium]
MKIASGKNRFSLAPIRHRAKVGAMTGLLLAAVYSCVAAALWLLPGPSDADRFRGGLLGIIAIYFSAAIIIGPLMGVLAPISRFRFGGALLGFIGGLLFGGSLMLMIASTQPLTLHKWSVTSLLFAVLVGVPLGHMVSRDS